MTNSNTLRINPMVRNWAVGALVALGSWSVLAGDILSDDAEDLPIVLSRDSIRIDSTVLCSLTAFETTLASQPRTTRVNVKADPDARSEIVAWVIQTLATLGFEQVSIKGWDNPGWFLYPPQPDTEFQGCDQSDPEEADNTENDS